VGGSTAEETASPALAAGAAVPGAGTAQRGRALPLVVVAQYMAILDATIVTVALPKQAHGPPSWRAVSRLTAE
jgi:hypothetical protein